MSGFWIGLVIVLVITLLIMCGYAALYSWAHEGRRSLWADSGEAIGWVLGEMKTEKPESLDQTGTGYVTTQRRGRSRR